MTLEAKTKDRALQQFTQQFIPIQGRIEFKKFESRQKQRQVLRRQLIKLHAFSQFFQASETLPFFEKGNLTFIIGVVCLAASLEGRALPIYFQVEP